MKYTEAEVSKRLGLEVLEPAMAEQMLASFYQTLDSRMMLKVASGLTDEQLAIFDGQDEAKKDALLGQLVPDFDKFFDAEAELLLQEIDDNAAAMLKDL